MNQFGAVNHHLLIVEMMASLKPRQSCTAQSGPFLMLDFRRRITVQ
jgi:hypothetical protein